MEKERKLQIIKTASKRFIKHGIHKTTLDEIARDLRIGKATIYHYFESKEDLYYATIDWESAQFIDEIKAIFNNESIKLKERFLEYLSFKENVNTKYQLIYNLLLNVLSEERQEKEILSLQNLLGKEEEVLSLVLNSLYTGRIETMNPTLPGFFINASWGVLFGNILNGITNPDRIINTKEMLVKFLDTILV